MPLNQPKLMQDIKSAFEAQKSNTGNQDAAIAKIALDLSIAIDTYVRSGTVITTVITNPGQAVAAPPPAGIGSTVAPGTGLGNGSVI
jgi:hypothetical protein|tara:strand:+ start:1403 stop:1663 length:261 start_codon:yes stop_codon:yes gene_type:complete